MKSLFVELIGMDDRPSFSKLANALELLSWHHIAHNGWSDDYPYTPKVKFKIAHSDEHVILLYNVEENYIRAKSMQHNEEIWKDSCVEFFVSFDAQRTYYNIEFNALGAGLIGYGSSEKDSRARLNSSLVSTVQTFSQITNLGESKKWEIILFIPKDLFEVKIFSRQVFHANFYKCGDELPEPHFLSWNPVASPKPNFHLPQFFGEIQFE